MITSVMLTGDAGGLNYVDDVIYETPKQAFRYCCSSDNTVKADYNFSKPVIRNEIYDAMHSSPIKKNTIKKQAPMQLVKYRP